MNAERARNRVMAYEARNTPPHFKALDMEIDTARLAVRRDLPYRACVADRLK